MAVICQLVQFAMTLQLVDKLLGDLCIQFAAGAGEVTSASSASEVHRGSTGSGQLFFFSVVFRNGRLPFCCAVLSYSRWTTGVLIAADSAEGSFSLSACAVYRRFTIDGSLA